MVFILFYAITDLNVTAKLSGSSFEDSVAKSIFISKVFEAEAARSVIKEL
jgi:hypothetical protein